MRNNWVSNVERSYEQLVTNAINRLTANAPEITDLSDNNEAITFMKYLAGVAEMLNVYIDHYSRNFIPTQVRTFRDAVMWAQAFDYRVPANSPATATLTFTMSSTHGSNVTIPSGTKVTTQSGIPFYTTANATIVAGQTTVSVTAIQKEVATPINFTSDGSANEVFNIPYQNVVDNSATLYVNGSVYWSTVETLAYSVDDDTHFIQRTKHDRTYDLMIGDGVNGDTITAGQSVAVGYDITEGSAGNVGVGTIVIIESSLSLPSGKTIICTNASSASGGADLPTYLTIVNRATKMLRTKWRAVTPQDFKDIAEAYPGVAKAGLIHECGKKVSLYIVPDGGGVASTILCDAVQNYISEDKKVVGTYLETLPAGIIRNLLVMNINVKPGYNRTVVFNAVTDALAEYGSYLNQELSGELKISDIYETVENVTGVKNSDILSITPIPYFHKLAGNNPITAVASILPTSTTTVKWKIVFTSATVYQLLKDDAFVGNYNTGTTYTFPEMTLLVTDDGNDAADSFSFVTYPVSTNLQLDEPSVPTILSGDITLNMFGGV